MARKLTFMAVIFALTMCVLIVPAASTTFASESPSTEYYNVQYDFSYEETVMPTNQIVRKYEKPSTFLGLNNTENSVTKTKAILASLGMGEDFIDELSNERLNEYANSKSITATTAYIKTTPEGVSTYVTKEDAENGSRVYDPPAYDDFNEPGGVPVWVEIGQPEGETSTDTYIRMILVVTQTGATTYHYSLDIEWLNEPTHRFYELIGISVQYNTIQNGTLSGWYTYDMDWFKADGNGLIPYRHDFEPGENGDFRYGVVDPWDGVGAIFSFPEDDINIVSWYIYYNFKAHFEVSTVIYNESDIINFNVAGSYAHMTQHTQGVPSVGLSLSGPSIGMSFNTTQSQDISCILFDEPFRYVPEEN